MDRNGEGNQQQEFETCLDRHGDWLEKTKGNLMVTATVIASMSFQVMVNPPGGVWQSDGCPRKNEELGCRDLGTAVLAETYKTIYLPMVISCTVSFFTSMSFILLAISGYRLRNRFIMGILVILMLAAVICLSAVFMFAMLLVLPNDDMVHKILLCYFAFWVLLVVLVIFIHLIWAICRCFGSQRRSHRGMVQLAPSSAN